MSTTVWQDPPAEAVAERASLHYVNDGEPGYSRQRWGQGFTWRDVAGEVIQDKAVRKQLKALAIPPAWEDVWICPTLNGHILATGRDADGRKQYLYHPDWEKAREQIKYERLIHFGRSLPQIREQVDKDLRRRKSGKAKMTALVIRMLEETGMRIGHDYYTEQNGSHGLTTLGPEHLYEDGNNVILKYVGKSHVDRVVPISDRKVANLLKAGAEAGRERLLEYEDEDGNHHPVTPEDVNRYLEECTGIPFTSKDFRTWDGTVAAVEALLKVEDLSKAEDRKELVKEIVQTVADILGNTPAVCRDYYIHPAVLAGCEDGSCLKLFAPPLPDPDDGYSLAETLVIRLLSPD